MTGLIETIASKASLFQLNILFLIGLALFGGSIGGRIFQKLKIPQVVGYLIIGMLIGRIGLNIVDEHIIHVMEPFNYFALGLIGFMIGGELKKEVLVKYGKQFSYILLFEGIAAFLCVFVLVGMVGSFFFENVRMAWGMALLLGAISSATAPAATSSVLWEYKTRGPLTTTILGIVALDDALALSLFAISASIAAKIIGNGSAGIVFTILYPLYEIGGSILLGGVAGFILSKILTRYYSESDKVLVFSIGTILLIIGMSLVLKLNMLLSSMTLGVIVVNFAWRISKDVFNIVKGFTPPIYVLFFVMVGASLNLHHLTTAVIAIIVVYLLGRTLGKMVGARLGARLAKAPKLVQDNLPLCLFDQAGVAIGLAIAAYHLFPGEIGNAVIIIITTTTFLVQLIAPPFIKYAVTRAGEVGLNITEEDLIKRAGVKDIMDKKLPLILENTPLSGVLKIFSSSGNLNYPVVDDQKVLLGIISVDSIRQTFMDTDIGQLLLAYDLMEPVHATIGPDAMMAEAKELLDKYNVDYLPVVDKDNKIAGLIERRMLHKLISTKMIELQKRVEQLG